MTRFHKIGKGARVILAKKPSKIVRGVQHLNSLSSLVKVGMEGFMSGFIRIEVSTVAVRMTLRLASFTSCHSLPAGKLFFFVFSSMPSRGVFSQDEPRSFTSNFRHKY